MNKEEIKVYFLKFMRLLVRYIKSLHIHLVIFSKNNKEYD